MERYLSHALDSLLIEKDRELLDVIVVNDGSKDKTSEIGHRYAEAYPEMIRVLDKSNGNYGSCVNAGLSAAQGQYVRILDADDTFATDAFQRYVEQLKSLDVDLVFSGLDHFNDKGESLAATEYVDITPLQVLTFDDVPESSWRISMACMTYRTQLLRDIHYHQTEGVSYSDEDWTFLPLGAVRKVSLIREPVYKYLIGREGQTIVLETRMKRVGQVIKVTTDIVNAYNQMDVQSEKVRKYLDYRLHSLIEFIYKTYILTDVVPDKTGLRQFDQFLKGTRKSTYDYAGSLALSPKLAYHYVEHWRMTGKGLPACVRFINNLLNRAHNMKG